MKWRITVPARRDLAGIWTYTQLRWNAGQADRYLDLLTARIVWLTGNKNLWIVRDDIHDGLYCYGEGRHRIFFTETSGVLTVVRVLHERMDIKRHVK